MYNLNGFHSCSITEWKLHKIVIIVVSSVHHGLVHYILYAYMADGIFTSLNVRCATFQVGQIFPLRKSFFSANGIIDNKNSDRLVSQYGDHEITLFQEKEIEFFDIHKKIYCLLFLWYNFAENATFLMLNCSRVHLCATQKILFGVWLQLESMYRANTVLSTLKGNFLWHAVCFFIHKTPLENGVYCKRWANSFLSLTLLTGEEKTCLPSKYINPPYFSLTFNF